MEDGTCGPELEFVLACEFIDERVRVFYGKCEVITINGATDIPVPTIFKL